MIQFFAIKWQLKQIEFVNRPLLPGNRQSCHLALIVTGPLLALSSWECDSESWLTGSLTVERQLHQCADELIQQWSDLRQWVNAQSEEVHHG